MKQNGQHSPCLGKFEYTDSINPKTVSGIHAPIDGLQKNVALLFCDGGETAGECRANVDGTRSDKTTAQYVIIDGACDNVQAGDVGALIDFEDKDGVKYQSAPVICPGTCKSGNLGDVVLDWSIEFGLDISDDSVNKDDKNFLKTSQSTSTYKGLYHGQSSVTKGVNSVKEYHTWHPTTSAPSAVKCMDLQRLVALLQVVTWGSSRKRPILSKGSKIVVTRAVTIRAFTLSQALWLSLLTALNSTFVTTRSSLLTSKI